MAEKRAAPRHSEHLSLLVSSEPQGRFEIETLNVSLSGAYCRTRYFLPLMTKLQVTLVLPTQRKPESLSASAVVVRINPSSDPGSAGFYEMALYFTGMDPSEQERLGAFLRSRPAGAN
jgi:hypothetical protein